MKKEWHEVSRSYPGSEEWTVFESVLARNPKAAAMHHIAEDFGDHYGEPPEPQKWDVVVEIGGEHFYFRVGAYQTIHTNAEQYEPAE